MDARHETARMRSGCQTGRTLRQTTPGRNALLHAALLPALALGLAGCHGGVDTDLLQRELRLQEDRIYELEDHLADCHAVVQTYQQENATLRKRLSALEPDKGTPPKQPRDRVPPDKPTRPELPDESTRKTDERPPNGLPDEVPVDLFPPVIEEGTNNQSPAGPSPDGSDAPTFGPESTDDLPTPPQNRRPTIEGLGTPAGGRAGELLPTPTTLNTPEAIDRIVLHRLLTPRESPKSDARTLQAVVEPRSSAGRPLRVAGDVSLMILDPSLPESDRRIARWDYSATETTTRWRRTGLGSGLHFELPLPVTVGSGTYELWARWITPQGEKLLDRVEFEVDRRALAGRTRTEWSPYR